MHALRALLLCLFLALAEARKVEYSLAKRAPAPFSEFTNNVVFKPLPNYTSWKTIYGRSLQLPDGSLLLTWENYPPEPPAAHFPIWKSVDGGATWFDFVNVTDQVNGWGLRYQPYLYLLPQAFGGYPAGTILLSGMSVPQDLSKAYMDLYASTDNGLTWKFVSHIGYGAGPETTGNGNKALWEPFFLMYNNQLICYYSDQRDAKYAQKLSHVVTSDLKTWSNPTDDVTDPLYTNRPGMAVVAHIKSTGRYILTYELCTTGGCPAYYKVSSSPLTFGSVAAHPILSNSTGVSPGASPFVIWTPHPNRSDGSGLIIMNGASQESVFINDDSAGVNGWKQVDVGQWSCHSRCLEIIDVKGAKKLMLSNAGNMWTGADNYVVVGVVKIPT